MALTLAMTRTLAMTPTLAMALALAMTLTCEESAVDSSASLSTRECDVRDARPLAAAAAAAASQADAAAAATAAAAAAAACRAACTCSPISAAIWAIMLFSEEASLVIWGPSRRDCCIICAS